MTPNRVVLELSIAYDANDDVRNEVLRRVHDFRLSISKDLNYIVSTSQKEVKDNS